MKDDPQVREILDHAADLPASDRAKFLDSACGGDAQLRAEVESLLVALNEADDFLVNPTVNNLTGAGAGLTDAGLLDPIGSSIGLYRLVEKIGEGGMGAVYLAEQDRPVRRRVALKIIKPGMDTTAVIRRFEAERQALALMDHSNIARVYDAGTTTTGRPYFAMEWVQGVPVTKYCDENLMTPQQRLALFIPICQAVQHAHTKGIVHRDLKPTNILVAIQDGKPSVKVIDFGIAKAMERQSTERTVFTQFGMMIGTPEYMSPEQAGGDPRQVDTRSDVFALGVVLYELLTGSTPLDPRELRESGYEQMMRTIREVDPPKPSMRLSTASASVASASVLRRMEPQRLARLLDGDLDLIVMKCLEKEQSRRYETATSLARDIERFLNGDPVEAKPPSNLYTLRKFASKNRKWLTVASAFALVVLTGLVTSSVVFWVWKTEAMRQRDAAVIARTQETAAKNLAIDRDHEAERARAEAERFSYRASVYAAGDAVNSGNFPKAVLLLQQAPRAYRNWEWNYLNAVVNPQVFSVPGDGIYFPDSPSRLLVNEEEVLSLYDVNSGRKVQSLADLKARGLTLFAMSPDFERIIVGGADHSLRVCRPDGKQLLVIPPEKGKNPYIYTTCFTHNHSKFFTCTWDDSFVRQWDTATGRQLMKFDALEDIAEHHYSPGLPLIVETCVSRDDAKLLTCSTDGIARVWDLSTNPPKCRSTYHDPAGSNVWGSFSPDGKSVVMCGIEMNRQGVIWDCTRADGAETVQFNGGIHANVNISAAFSPDGKRVAFSGGTYANVFDAATGQLVTVLKGHYGRVNAVWFVSDGDHLLTSSNKSDQTVRFWDLRLPPRPQVFADPASPVVDAQFTADGEAVVCRFRDALLRVYGLSTGVARSEFDPAKVNRRSRIVDTRERLGPTSEPLAVPAGDGTVWVVDAASGLTLARIGDPLPGASPVVTAFTADHRRAVIGSALGTIRLWDLQSGKATATLCIAGPGINRILISPLGDRLATESSDDAVRLWKVPTAAQTGKANLFIGTLYNAVRALGGCHDCVFSHDGRGLAVASGFWCLVYDTSTARLAEKADPSPAKRDSEQFYSHWCPVKSIAFSGDNSRVLVCYEDQIAEVFDIVTKQPVRTLFGHDGSVLGGCFSPNGTRILTWSLDKTARLWDAARGDELCTLQGHTGPVIKCEFSPDGTKILTVSQDGAARVWNSTSNEEHAAGARVAQPTTSGTMSGS